jgi:tetratricopeptide (TPR) repeat protein
MRLDRHEPFLLLLGRVRARSLRWYRARAGLVALELLDQLWSTRHRVAPVSVLRRDAVRRAVTAVRPKAARLVLTHLLDLAMPGPHPQLEVLTALTRYGRRLQGESEYTLAAHVYTIVIDYAAQAGFFALVAETYEHLGTCLRESGDLQGAIERYRTGLTVAARCRDERTKLQIGVALGNLHRMRNEVAEAVAMLDSVLLRAKALDAADLVTRAAHERGNVALARREYREALRYFAEGFGTCTEVKERSRMLNDIALSFEKLGFLDDAHAIWLVVFRGPKGEKYARWAAAINLMMLAYVRGDTVSFDLYRHALEPAPMPARLLVSYWLEVGDGSTALGRPQDAVAAYTRAKELAQRYQLMEEHELAKESLAGRPMLERPKATDPSSLPAVVVELLQKMRALRPMPVMVEATLSPALRTTLRRGRPPRSGVA